MEISPQIITVHARDIEIDAPSLFWPEEPSGELLASVAEFGVLSPVLADFTQGRPLLLAGRKRVLAARRLKLPLPAFGVDLGRGSGRAVDAGKLYLASNLGQPVGELRLVRAGRYFSELMGFGDFKAACADLLGLAGRDKTWDSLAAWLGLPLWLDERLAAARLPLAAAPLLAGLSAEELASLRPYLEYAGFSRNQLAAILEPLRELALGRVCALSGLLDSPEFAGLRGLKLSPADFTARLAGLVRKLRYPLLSEMENKFADKVKELTRGTGWKITASQSFESDCVRLEASLSGAAELEDLLRQLEGMRGAGAWEELWSLGRGGK